MTDYTKLVEALRCENTGDDECGSSDCPYWSGLGCMDGQLMEDAADAIEALQAEVYEANKSADAYRSMYFAKRGDITIEMEKQRLEFIGDLFKYTANLVLNYDKDEAEADGEQEVQE